MGAAPLMHTARDVIVPVDGHLVVGSTKPSADLDHKACADDVAGCMADPRANRDRIGHAFEYGGAGSDDHRKLGNGTPTGRTPPELPERSVPGRQPRRR